METLSAAADCLNSVVSDMRFVETNGNGKELNRAAFSLRFYARALELESTYSLSPYATRKSTHEDLALGSNLGKALQEFAEIIFHAASTRQDWSNWSNALAIVWSVHCFVIDGERRGPAHRVCFLMHRASTKHGWTTSDGQLAAALGMSRLRRGNATFLGNEVDWQTLSQILIRFFTRVPFSSY